MADVLLGGRVGGQIPLIPSGIERTAVFSKDRVYRYALKRIWEPKIPPVLFVGFNPSTADETQDDPTIRRCLHYAKDWGYGGLLMANVFAYRATNPRDLPIDDPSPAGETWVCTRTWNDFWIEALADEAGLIVAAWGAISPPPSWERRPKKVHRILGRRAHCLGTTDGGHPRHPLYVRRDVRPTPLRLS